MRFGQSFLDEIRDRVPISDVVGTRVTFDKKKSNKARGDFWACCPFHGENTASFHCEDRKGRYYCFGCGVSGDHFRFLTELDGLSFPEAVERVAAMAGIAMPAPDPEAEKREKERASLHDVMELATRFFQDQLQVSGGAAARAYLRDRGLSDETIGKFRIGFAPDSRKALKEFLVGKNVPKEAIEACGLVVHGEDIPVSYDRFRDRIMFPIEDAQGRVIAFGGRAMKKDAPAKYLNSPETVLFHKGNILFNFKRARAHQAKAGGPIVAVEGYMDVIALDQAGFPFAVAPLGTALTEEQLERLWRSCDEPVLCFDGDQAGVRAAFRALELALPGLKPGRSVRFALLPDGKDPDDLVRQDGAAAFSKILDDARNAADMLWLRETGGQTFETPERRAKLEQVLREAVALIGDESVRRHYGQDMRERTNAYFGQAPSQGRGQGGRDKRGFAGGPSPRNRIAVSDRLTRSRMVGSAGPDMPLREAALISAILCHPDLMDDYFDVFMQLEFEHPGLLSLRNAILKAHTEHGGRTREELVAHPAVAALSTVTTAMDATVRRARLWVVTSEAAYEDARQGFEQAMRLHRRAKGLSRELKAAEDALARDGSDANLARFLDIQREVRRMQGLDALVEGFGLPSGRPVKSF